MYETPMPTMWAVVQPHQRRLPAVKPMELAPKATVPSTKR
jgi:hypothetical protein